MPLLGQATGGFVSPTAEVVDYEAQLSFFLKIRGQDIRIPISERFEVLVRDGIAQKFRSQSTKGAWESVTDEFRYYMNTSLKQVIPAESPGPVDEVKSYKAIDNFDLVNGFPVTRGDILDVQVRNGTPRAARKDKADLWTVAIDELRVRINGVFLIPEQEPEPEIAPHGVEDNEGWFDAIVTKPFSIGNAHFAIGCRVEVNVKKNLIRDKNSSHDIPFDSAFFGLPLEAIPAIPAQETLPQAEDPVLAGEPLEVALTLLPTIKEVFHWVPGHDWMVTVPKGESKKVGISLSLDFNWSLELVIDEDESIAILFFDSGGDVRGAKSRDILNTHCWTDFVGWLSVAASLIPHPLEVKGRKFLTTRTVDLGENRWEAGQIISVLDHDIDDQVRDLVSVGAMVLFTEGPIFGCEGCWAANNGCVKGKHWRNEKCDEWTLTEPPPPPPKKRYLTTCSDCKHKSDQTDQHGIIVKMCAKGNDPYSTDECFTYEFDHDNDIPF